MTTELFLYLQTNEEVVPAGMRISSNLTLPISHSRCWFHGLCTILEQAMMHPRVSRASLNFLYVHFDTSFSLGILQISPCSEDLHFKTLHSRSSPSFHCKISFSARVFSSFPANFCDYLCWEMILI